MSAGSSFPKTFGPRSCLFRDYQRTRHIYERVPKYWWGQRRGDLWEYHIQRALGQDHAVPYPRHWWFKYYKRWFVENGKINPPIKKAVLPAGYREIDPNVFIAQDQPIERPKLDYILPWPENPRLERGTREDPNYRPEGALFFYRMSKLLEGENTALHFTNAVLESANSRPKAVQDKINSITSGRGINLSDQMVSVAHDRLKWCQDTDATLIKLPKYREYPKLHVFYWRKYGPPPIRKEFNVMWTLYDVCDLWMAKDYGLLDRRTLWWPYSVLNLERDGKKIILDLGTDFLSLTKTPLTPFSSSPLATIDSPLVSIYPLNWANCFETRHFYPEDYEFVLPSDHNIDTVYLTSQSVKAHLPHWVLGKIVMYGYGYAMQQAKRLYGEEFVRSGRELPEPITVKVVDYNPYDSALYVCYYQLNTTSFDSPLKNQVWLEEPAKELEDKLEKLMAVQLHALDPTSSIIDSSPVNQQIESNPEVKAL